MTLTGFETLPESLNQKPVKWIWWNIFLRFFRFVVKPSQITLFNNNKKRCYFVEWQYKASLSKTNAAVRVEDSALFSLAIWFNTFKHSFLFYFIYSGHWSKFEKENLSILSCYLSITPTMVTFDLWSVSRGADNTHI